MTTVATASTMTKVLYLDTSAAVKLISDEQESDGLRSYLDEGPTLVSSDLLETELRRIGIRHDIDQVLITSVLDGDTDPIDQGSVPRSGTVPADRST